MAFWSKKSGPVNRITAEQLATYGRYKILGEQSGIDASRAFELISPLNELIYTSLPEDRATAIAELSRHAEVGEWERVGAWKYVRDMLSEQPDTIDLIDAGLQALDHMRVTNLAHILAPIDRPRYERLTGHQPSSDGFIGQPVFDSDYGPSIQFYVDSAVASSAARKVKCLTHVPGVTPVVIGEAEAELGYCLWHLGTLIFRGPLLVSSDYRFEPNIVADLVRAFEGTDHHRAADLVLGIGGRPDLFGELILFKMLGAARFVEEYLDVDAREESDYLNLLNLAMRELAKEPPAFRSTVLAVSNSDEREAWGAFS